MTYSYPTPPHQRPTPAKCSILARRLRDAVRDFQAAGVRPHRLSRLRAEAELLEDVARARAFPSDQHERRRIANAIRDASEFRTIRKLLGQTRERHFLRRIADTGAGSAARDEVQRGPYQLQSELWIGAIFQAGGLPITPIPPAQSGSPDFFADIEGTRYGIEVKRPQSRKAITTAIERGREQVRVGGTRGGIALDVTDCLPEASLFLHDTDAGIPPYDEVDASFTDTYRSAGRLIFDPERKEHRPGCRHLCFLLVFAQGWRWMRNGPRVPELFLCSEFGLFVTAKGNATHWDVERLRSAYKTGLAKAGFGPTRETRTIL